MKDILRASMMQKMFGLLFSLAAMVSSQSLLGGEQRDSSHDIKATLTPLTLLVVDKNALTAELQTFPDLTQESMTLGKFKIAIGKELGDKQKEGDNRTPEGIYFTQNLLDTSRLPAKYGARAVPINFPNPIDRLEKKTGYGIWLHGVEQNSRVEEANVTEGCVAFYNEDIAALSNWLVPNRAIVVIAEEASAVNIKEERLEVEKNTKEWLKAWQDRDIDRYAALYHPKFEDKKGDYKSYRNYKKAVFRSYKQMEVTMTQMRVVTHPKYAISLMNQYFNGDNRYVSQGRKILYWQKDDSGQWRIIREGFSGQLFESVPFTNEDYATLLSMRKTPNGNDEKKIN